MEVGPPRRSNLLALALTALVVGLAAAATTVAPDEAHAAGPIAFAILVDDVTGTCALASIDLGTGAITPTPTVVPGAECAHDLAVAPDGTLYGIRDDVGTGTVHVVRFDATTGAPTDLGAVSPFNATISGQPFIGGGLAFDLSGRFLVLMMPTNDPACTGGAGVCLYRGSDPAAPGSATLVGPSGLAVDHAPWSMTVGCSAVLATTLDFSGQGGPPPSELARVDASSGNLSSVGANGQLVTGLELARDGTLWALFVTFPNGLNNPPVGATAIIDQATGAVTKVADLAGGAAALGVAFGLDCSTVAAVAPRFTG